MVTAGAGVGHLSGAADAHSNTPLKRCFFYKKITLPHNLYPRLL